MYEPEIAGVVSEVRRDSEDQRFWRLVEETDAGWKTTIKDVSRKVLADPGWLVSDEVFRKYELEKIKSFLSELSVDDLTSLDGLTSRYRLGQYIFEAFILRFIEVFSEEFNFPYVWRGGSLKNLEGGVRGTFAFDTDTAKSFVESSYDGLRENPCLIGIPISGIVDDFRKNPRPHVFLPEHNYDGMFSASFDLYLREVPDGTMVYLPD